MCYKYQLDSFQTMKHIATLKNFKYVVYAIEILSNGNLIIGSNDGALRVFDPNSDFTLIKDLIVHRETICTILTIKDGNFVTRSWDRLILWNLLTLEYKQLVGHNRHIKAVLELENTYLVSSDSDQTLILWDEDTDVRTRLISDTIAKLHFYYFIIQ
jgi:WD40 repeat protein